MPAKQVPDPASPARQTSGERRALKVASAMAKFDAALAASRDRIASAKAVLAGEKGMVATPSTNGRIPKAKRAKNAITAKPRKVASQPTASQLRKAAALAREADVPELAEKYDKVAADAARYEALAGDRGNDLSVEGFNEVLSTVARPL